MYLCLIGKDEAAKEKQRKRLPLNAEKFLFSFERLLPEEGFVLGRDIPSCADFVVYDLITSTYPNLGNLDI